MGDSIRTASARTASAVAAWCLTLVASVPASAQVREVWVVNEGDHTLSVFTDLSGQFETVELPSQASPHGIAFSTLNTIEQQPGDFAFVTQGPDIRVVIATDRRVLRTFDVATALGEDRVDVVLRGAASALTDRFVDRGGVEVERNYLHVVADVRPGGMPPFRPWFVVLDQFLLSDPGAQDPVVAFGPLLDEPLPPGPLLGMEVEVLGSPSGDLVQRAWYTFQEQGPAPVLGATLVAGSTSLANGWRRVRTEALEYGAGTALPDGIHPGSPFSRELPLLPDGPNGVLLDLQTGDRCAIGGTPRAIAIAGPGLGSYSIWTAKLDPTGQADVVQEVQWLNCESKLPIPVGLNPVDLDVVGPIEWEEVWVASRDSDSVHVIQRIDPTTAIEIRTGQGPPCEKCPRSVAVRKDQPSTCRAVRRRVELINAKTAIRHVWEPLGCGAGAWFKLWCRCLAAEFADCPLECVQNCPDPPLDQNPTIWCEVDASDATEIVTDNDSSKSGDSSTNVEPAPPPD